jgi:hypothetical protein
MPYRHLMAGVVALLMLSLVTSSASAECDGRAVLSESDFADPAASANWSYDTAADIAIGGGKMTISLPAAPFFKIIEYEKDVVFNTDPRPTEICGDFRFTAEVGDGVDTGILFWSVRDRSNKWNAYLWVASSSGDLRLLRLNNGQVETVYDASSSAAHTGANASNSLKVSWDNDGTSFFINGQEVVKKPIFPPLGYTRFGVVGSAISPARTATSVEVRNLRLTAPSERP